MEEVSVSVVVPVYNAEQYLERCVNSLRNQTLRSLEIILVDDGSSDRSGKICDQYVAADSRVRVLHKRNEGAMFAWIDGVRMASGKYIGFVDSDDWVDKEMYKKLYQKIESVEGDIIACGCIRKEKYRGKVFFDINKEIIYDKIEIREKVIHDLFENICYGNARWNKLFRRDLLLNNLVFCNEKIIVGEDLHIVLACTLDAKSVVYFPEPLYYYYANENSITASFKKSYLDDSLVLYHKLKFLMKVKKVGKKNLLEVFFSKLVLHNVLSVAWLSIYRHEKFALIKEYCEQSKAAGIVFHGLNDLNIKERFIWICIRKGWYGLLIDFVILDIWRKRIKKMFRLLSLKKNV